MNASDHPAELQRGRRGLETSAPPAGCHIGWYALRGLRASEPDLVRPMAEKFARSKVPARGYARMMSGKADSASSSRCSGARRRNGRTGSCFRLQREHQRF